jgi:hypothetical protein
VPRRQLRGRSSQVVWRTRTGAPDAALQSNRFGSVSRDVSEKRRLLAVQQQTWIVDQLRKGRLSDAPELQAVGGLVKEVVRSRTALVLVVSSTLLGLMGTDLLLPAIPSLPDSPGRCRGANVRFGAQHQAT